MALSDEEKNLLAAEYVLGTLPGPDRIRFQKLLSYDNHLRAHLNFWEKHLTSFCDTLETKQNRTNLWEKNTYKQIQYQTSNV